MKKEALPHLKLKNKDAIDLYFEYLNVSDRKKVLQDLKNGENIKLPNFGVVLNKDIANPTKFFEEKDLDQQQQEENYIEQFITHGTNPKYPAMMYDSKNHTYKLKSRYDIEKMLKDIVDSHK
jgi:hypothetical protein